MDKEVKRGRTNPSCKSNYAFYDFNESLTSANKRGSKTEMQTEKKGRHKKKEKEAKRERRPQGGERGDSRSL